MWNLFKKAKQSGNKFAMNMASRIAIKKLAKMSPKERDKIARDFMRPENKDRMLAVLEHMKASGQISEEQYREAKIKMNL